MGVHRVVHRGRREHRPGSGEQQGGEHIVGEPHRGASQHVRGGRRHDHEVRLSREPDVRERPVPLPQGGEDRAPGERLERDRPDELGGHQPAQVIVLGLRGDFARGHNPHHLLLPVDCFSWAASRVSCRTKSDSKLAMSPGARCATPRSPLCTRSMTSRTAVSRSSFTSTRSYTSPISRRAVSTSRVAMSIRCDSSASDSVRRLRSRSINTRGEGGITNSTTDAGRGYAFRTCRAPVTSTSSTTCFPPRSTRSTSLRRVPYSPPAYSAASRNPPASRRRSNSSRVRK